MIKIKDGIRHLFCKTVYRMIRLFEKAFDTNGVIRIRNIVFLFSSVSSFSVRQYAYRSGNERSSFSFLPNLHHLRAAKFVIRYPRRGGNPRRRARRRRQRTPRPHPREAPLLPCGKVCYYGDRPFSYPVFLKVAVAVAPSKR